LEIEESSGLRLEIAAVHPTHPNLVYGCFSRLPSSHRESNSIEASKDLSGMYVSTDEGDNWSVLSRDLGPHSVEDTCLLGIAPSNPDVMLAHGRTGVLISRDGGKNWEPTGNQRDLESPAHLKGYAEQLARMKAKGAVPVQEWPFQWTELTILNILFDPDHDNIAYLLTNKGLYRTLDGSRSWCLLNTGDDNLYGLRSLYIDHELGSRLFVGTLDRILTSADGGCHFDIFFDPKRMTSGK